MSNAASKRRRRGTRLWLAFALLVPIAMWLGRVANLAHDQRRAIHAIRRAGGDVVFDYQMPAFSIDWHAPHPGPEWLRRWISDEPFRTVRQVNLAECRSGAQSTEALAALDLCPDVVLLYLRGTRITDEGFSIIVRQRKLEGLILHNAALPKCGLQGLKNLKKLRTLCLSSTRFREADLVEIAHLPCLEELELGNPYNSGVGSEGLRHLVGLAKLRRLDLKGHSRIDDSGCVYLGRISSLRDLNMEFTGIGDEGLALLGMLEQLRQLFVGGTKISDKGLLALGSLKHLHKIWVGDSAATEAGLVKLREERPGLEAEMLSPYALWKESPWIDD